MNRPYRATVAASGGELPPRSRRRQLGGDQPPAPQPAPRRRGHRGEKPALRGRLQEALVQLPGALELADLAGAAGVDLQDRAPLVIAVARNDARVRLLPLSPGQF